MPCSTFSVKVKYTLPGIQQGRPLILHRANRNGAPSGGCAGRPLLAVFTVRQNEGRRLEHTAAVQQIGRGSHIQPRSGKKVMIRAVPEPYPVIAGPCQRPQNHLPGILPRRTVQRDDESGASLLGGAGAGSGYQGKFMPRATSSSLIRNSPPQVPRKLVTKYRSARKPSCADAARCRRMPSFPSFRITAHCRKVSDSLWERTWISTRTG